MLSNRLYSGLSAKQDDEYSAKELKDAQQKPRWFSVGLSAAIISSAVMVTGCATKPVYQTNTAPVVQMNARGVPDFYQVQRGDTVSQIAERYGLNYRHIGALNRLDSRYTIYAGQWLQLWKSSSNASNNTGSYRPANATNQRTNAAQNNTQTASGALPSQTTPAVQGNPNYQTAPLRTGVVQGYRYPTNNPVVKNFDVNTGSQSMWFSGSVGDPIVASNSGEVLYAGSELTEYGNLVMVRHDDTNITVYAHNDQLLVKEGDRVAVGQPIATMGRSGQTNQVALEFQLRQNGTPVDPRSVLGL